MDLISLAVTAALFLLFNLIVYLKRGRPNLLSLLAFLGLTALAFTYSRVLLALIVLLVLAGLILYLTGSGNRRALAASTFVVVLVLAGNTLFPFVDGPSGWETMTALERSRLRAEFPFELLSDRLSGQRRDLARLSGDSAFGSSDKAWRRLHGQEYNYGFELRSSALQILHGDALREFMKRPEFGNARMRVWPLPRELTPGEDKLVTLDGNTYIELEEGNTTSYDLATSTPTEEWLMSAHLASLYSFLDPTNFGYFRNRDAVAGFRPHQFRYLPRYPRPSWYPSDGSPPRLEEDPVRPLNDRPFARWRILKLELVGLLLHETPVVYVSDHLPSMKDAKQLPTRSLDSFEKSTLSALERGEDIIPSREGDTLRILGSIRAAKQCLKCHDVERGSLLGAFSYTLRKEEAR
jgi:hypothetical protein